MGILAEFKTKFEATPQKFEQATLIDETTIVEFEALEVGFPLFIVTDSGSIPAPEGTHSLGGDYLGVTVTVDAEGIITEVVDERGTEVPSEETTIEENMSAEKVEAIVNGKLESFTAVLEGVAEMMNAISENNKMLNETIASLKAEFESFKAQPSEATKESEKFSRVGNLTAKQQFLKTYKNV